jgi:hypothetical protein
MSAGRVQRVGGKVLRTAGKVARDCCCGGGGGYDPGDDCEKCAEGETPAAWTLTVADMTLCCVWQWNTVPGSDPVRYEWFSVRLGDADPNGTFCLNQCDDYPCRWVSDPFGADIYQGDSVLGEEASLDPPTAETACASWPYPSHYSTPLRWVLWHETSPDRWRLQLLYRDSWVVWETMSASCADDQEIDNSAGECEDGHTNPWPETTIAVCGEISPYGYELGGATGGTLALTKGCV